MSANYAVTKQTQELYDASEKGDAIRVDSLVNDEETDINWKKHENYGSSSLLVAIENNHTKVATALIKAGADLAVQRTPDLNTPLHQASLVKNAEIVAALLKEKDVAKTQGVDHHEWNMVEAVNQFINTPLHTASMAGNVDCVRLLLEAGADVNAQNMDGSTPLHHAFYCENLNEQVVELLCKHGAAVNALDKYEVTPAMVGAKKGQMDGIKVVLAHKANLKLTDAHGHDALYYAQHKNNDTIVKYLQSL